MTAVSGGMPAGGRRPHWLDAERVRVYSWLLLGIFAIGAAIWTALSLPGLVDPNGKPLGYDFIAFWSAARLALEGRPEAAYDWSAIAAMHRLAVPAMQPLVFAWHYPPTFLVAVLPLGLLPYPAALAAFTLAGTGLWAALVRRVAADRRAWIVAAAAPAGLISLLDGQNGFLTAALAGFALVSLKRRPVLAGALIGLLAIKPHLAVLFPVALLADRQWRAIAAAAATAALFALASLAMLGAGTLLAFLHDLPAGRALIDGGAVPWGSMPSPYVFMLSLGAPPAWAMGSQAAVAVLAAAAVWRAWHAPSAPFEARAATLLAGSLLVSPFLFSYDLTWAALAAGWLALLGLRIGFRRYEREVLLLAWLAPFAMAPVQALTHLQLGCPALLLLLWAALRRAAPLDDGERAALRRVRDALCEARWVTRARVLRWGSCIALACAVALAADVAAHTRLGVTDAQGVHLGRDFVNFWSGAKLAAAGRAGLAYDPEAFNGFIKSLVGPVSELKLYSYPPVAMVLTWPLAAVGFIPGFVLWTLLGIAACAWPLSRLVGWRAAAIAAAGAPAAFLDTLTGQTGHFTAALLGGGLLLLDRSPIAAGLLLGSLCFKPQLGPLLPLALAAAARWRAFAAAAAAVIGWIGASLLLTGPQSWLGYRAQARLQTQLMQAVDPYWHRTQSVFLAAHNAGLGLGASAAAQAAAALLAGAATFLVWRSGASLGIKAATLVVAAFLVTPYAWDYDLVVLLFAAAWLAREGAVTGFLPWERLAVVLLLVQPIVTLHVTALTGVQLAPLGFGFALAVLVRRGLSSERWTGAAAARLLAA